MSAGHRRLIEMSFEAAQQGFSRHSADITSSRNWCITGILVYYGAIIASDTPATPLVCIPPVVLTLVATAFTIYERGNAERLRLYCVEAAKELMSTGDGSEEVLLPLQAWLEEKKPKAMLKFYRDTAAEATGVWKLLLVLALAMTATGQTVVCCRPRRPRPDFGPVRPPAGYYPDRGHIRFASGPTRGRRLPYRRRRHSRSQAPDCRFAGWAARNRFPVRGRRTQSAAGCDLPAAGCQPSADSSTNLDPVDRKDG
jgi:hypothetical protein